MDLNHMKFQIMEKLKIQILVGYLHHALIAVVITLLDYIMHAKKRVYINIHRLVLTAFEHNYGYKKCIDHIDNSRLNNCLFNLRFATRQENQFNRSMNSRNTSGVKGVYWKPERNKWCSRIMVKGRTIHIGYFDDIEDAKQARRIKAIELFCEFINQCEG